MTYLPPSPPQLNYGLAGPGDSPTGRLVAWVVILVSVAALVANTYRLSRAPRVAAFSARVDMQIALIGKYDVAANKLLSSSSQSKTSVQNLLTPLETSAATPLDKLAVATVAAELIGKPDAVERIDKIGETVPPSQKNLAAGLRKLFTDGPATLSDSQRHELIDRLGWFGRLALTNGLPEDNPQRQAVMSEAYRVMALLGVATIAIIVGPVLGFILLVVLLIWLRDRKLQPQYQSQPNGTGFFLEAFAIYVAGLTVLEMGGEHLPAKFRQNLFFGISAMFIPTVLAISWPLIRGAQLQIWRAGLGWHTGRGVFKEMGMGVVGYIAGLPIIAIGLIVMFILTRVAHANPSHPINRMIGINAGVTLTVFFIASIYAPLTEETMFRGAFFHALRSRYGWLLSAIVSSFIFAAIHPQGWTVIPALMSIAIVFSALREWRATIIASATAHCLHNTVLVLFMVLAMNGMNSG